MTTIFAHNKTTRDCHSEQSEESIFLYRTLRSASLFFSIILSKKSAKITQDFSTFSIFICSFYASIFAYVAFCSINSGIVYGNLAKRSKLRIHCSIPQLLGIHFPKTFVSLDVQTTFLSSAPLFN